MGIRSSWLNFIMHLTAAIAERKQDLIQHHSIKTFFDVISIILLEGVLSIVSIPLYFSTSSASLSPENEFNIQYAIRKTLTFTFFFLLAGIFVVKAFVIGGLVIHQLQQPQQITNAALPAPTDPVFLTAKIDPNMAVPIIQNIGFSPQNAMVVQGSSKPLSKIFIMVAEKNAASVQPAMQMLTTQSDEKGLWQITSSSMFHLKSGFYLFQAQMFDPGTQTKSPLSSVQEFNFNPSFTDNLIGFLDFVSNVLIISFIGIGFFVIFLTL